MEQDEIEEGEVCDDGSDSDNNYTPLERPNNYSVVQPIQRFPTMPQYSESEEELQSSESESDSDTGIKKSKKPRIKLKPRPIPRAPRQKKYDIWSTRVQEDVLAETLNSCDVTSKDRTRDIETYDYTLGYKFYNSVQSEAERKNNKRTREDRGNPQLRYMRRSSSEEKQVVKGVPREIKDLDVTIYNSPEEIAKDIAAKLNEERDDLIARVVNVMGKERSLEFFHETKQIELEGGMMIMNQTRRRTAGGVFLFIVRNDYYITPEQKQKIFDEDKRKLKEIQKEKKRKKVEKMRTDMGLSSKEFLPELLTRAELLASNNPERKVKEAEDADVKNPPPSPETDHCSRDGTESPGPILNSSHSEQTALDNARGTLQTYDDDYLDINGSNDMDLF